MKSVFTILICFFTISLSAQSFTAKTAPDMKVSKFWSNEVRFCVEEQIKEARLEKSVVSYRGNGFVYPVYTDRQKAYVINKNGEFICIDKFANFAQ